MSKVNFEELKDFLENRMRLSHIYQPLLIKSLIESGGSSTVRQLALRFLAEDESQIMYYEKRLKEMPIRVLSRHRVITKNGDLVSLNLNIKKLTLEQKAEIKKMCEEKMQEFIAARGLEIWDYRLGDQNSIPDSLRYRVLSESNGRCSLCGVTKDERPLDIDHIIPKSKGGKTTYENLQVLCSKCNRSKGNKDDKDFRQSVYSKSKDCIFCEVESNAYIVENEYAYAIKDGYPVTKGHSLIISKRHVKDLFELSKIELSAMYDLLNIRRKQILEEDHLVEGFNVGVNCGEAAGQTIFHCHIHLIPRRKGDVDNPKGGVRGVIPHKMNYEDTKL